VGLDVGLFGGGAILSRWREALPDLEETPEEALPDLEETLLRSEEDLFWLEEILDSNRRPLSRRGPVPVFMQRCSTSPERTIDSLLPSA
jgi:hypothetical protein